MGCPDPEKHAPRAALSFVKTPPRHQFPSPAAAATRGERSRGVERARERYPQGGRVVAEWPGTRVCYAVLGTRMRLAVEYSGVSKTEHMQHRQTSCLPISADTPRSGQARLRVERRTACQ